MGPSVEVVCLKACVSRMGRGTSDCSQVTAADPRWTGWSRLEARQLRCSETSPSRSGASCWIRALTAAPAEGRCFGRGLRLGSDLVGGGYDLDGCFHCLFTGTSFRSSGSVRSDFIGWRSNNWSAGPAGAPLLLFLSSNSPQHKWEIPLNLPA